MIGDNVMKKNILLTIGLGMLIIELIAFVTLTILNIPVSNTVVALGFIPTSIFSLASLIYYDITKTLSQCYASEKFELYVLCLIGIIFPSFLPLF